MGNAKVDLAESAYIDLEEIESIIGEASPTIARAFINKIFDKIDLLVDYPLIGKQVREFENPKIRELLQGRYRIVYYLKTDQEIEVLRIIHGSKLLDLE